MNRTINTILIALLAIIVGVGAVAYGASTAPKPTHPAATVKPLSSAELSSELAVEQATITSVMTASYPAITTDYLINQGQLFDQGEWYGTTLTYKGSDSMNRDTLRVLMQKKQGVWVMRTTPPQPNLSTVEFPDVPKSILETINKPISLPGSDAPAVN